MPEPIGFIVFRRRETGIPSVLADAVADNGGTIYNRKGAEDRIDEWRRHGHNDYEIGAVVPVEDQTVPPRRYTPGQPVPFDATTGLPCPQCHGRGLVQEGPGWVICGHCGGYARLGG